MTTPGGSTLNKMLRESRSVSNENLISKFIFQRSFTQDVWFIADDAVLLSRDPIFNLLGPNKLQPGRWNTCTFYCIVRALVPGRHKTDFIVTKGQNKNKRSMLTMFFFFFSWREILSQKGLWTQTHRRLLGVSMSTQWSQRPTLRRPIKTLKKRVINVWLYGVRTPLRVHTINIIMSVKVRLYKMFHSVENIKVLKETLHSNMELIFICIK